ncbi:putative Queuosine Q salvage protein family [Microdochium nivale]|nr:putative Queuosine Q salvage protein family [Microdochium nivale]
MSDDEADPELLELLRQHLHGNPATTRNADPETGVLQDVEWQYDNSIDVSLNMRATKAAAAMIWTQMQAKDYSTQNWSDHPLHPKARNDATVAFIFTMDLLNFSFWSAAEDQDERYAVEYRGSKWTGYASLLAGMQRAIEEGVPITDPHYWQDEHECTLESLGHVFRSCTDEEMPLLRERLECLREAGQVLYEKYECSFTALIAAARGSAAGLVNILARDFSCFRDEFPPAPGAGAGDRSRPVRFLKRAQILVADLWACFDGAGPGEFRDIDKITIFADYRIPQILASLGCIEYSPTLLGKITRREIIESGSSFEMQLRAASIWSVDAIQREIRRTHPEATHVNAVLIDFFLYDTMKQLEAEGKETMPHHRTRSIWY